jgi:hypothetical protein
VSVLNETRPGDQVVLTVLHEDQVRDYTLNLSAWPEGSPERTSGFMGITYYDPALVLEAVGQSVSPAGFLRFLTVPFDIAGFANPLRCWLSDPGYAVPRPPAAEIIPSLLVRLDKHQRGVFNAIPRSLDGGYILKSTVPSRKRVADTT